MTDTPCALCSPTPTKTATNTFTITFTKTVTATPTATMTATTPAGSTPTISPTLTVPMGLFVAASFVDSQINVLGYSVSTVATLFTISVNHNPEDTATMSITTPSNGTVPLTWLQDANMGTYWVSQYQSSYQYIYTPNAVYSMDITTSLGTAHAVMNAPGGITFSANGASVTALYPGNYDAADVSRISPAPVTTYVSPGTSIGSPFTFPGSAYSSPSYPATFAAAYAAATTVYSFTGTAGAVGAFVGTQVSTGEFSR
jgi:hypothetical protein